MCDRMRASYDALAAEYARRLRDELDHKPFDRAMLEEFAARVAPAGLICDLGCGPGHIARFLRDRGAQVFGIDLSEGMLAEARRLNQDISFLRGTMLSVGIGDATTPWMKEVQMATGIGFESVVLFALDQFCLIGYPVPPPESLRRSVRMG